MLLSKMSPINPGLQIDVGAPDFPCVLLLHVMLLGLEMPLVGPIYPCITVVMSQGLTALASLGADIAWPPRQDAPAAPVGAGTVVL
jgi:hypothetical protein